MNEQNASTFKQGGWKQIFYGGANEKRKKKKRFWPESSALGGVADFSVGNIANRRQHLPRKSFFLLGNVASGRQCCGRHGNVANRSIT